ncbi:MAG: dTDP-glucose 4,6-dehydratase [Lachnospiraceae bacterium]|nr:dTDP-glucose 4,6-dehydratase [Lachnospiraceae bacterium]
MKTYLVTGGAGFIGSNFIHYLLEECGNDVRVINLDALTYAGNPDNLKDIEKDPRYSFVQADLADREAVFNIIKANPIDYVVHFAAESHVDNSIKDPAVFIRTNVLGTNNLLDAVKEAWETEAAKTKRFLYVSTDEVYGMLPDDGVSFFTEETPFNPSSPYAASKAAADMLVMAYHKTYGFPALVTNCSNNYGPNQFPEKFIPLIITNALKGKKIPLYGSGTNIRDWLFVKDHCRGIHMALLNGKCGERYNIGGHNEKRNIEIIKIIIKTLRELLPENDERRSKITEELIEYVPDRKGHDVRYAINPDKIKKELGWEVETHFEEGIKKTVEWYINNAEWCERVLDGSYREKST